MINAIEAGALIRLPSGNVVLVVARQPGQEWLCQYVEGSKARGDVVFAAAFLLAWGTRI